MKENKGITLISLVVTIIILIILAGVSINMLFGEKGIITKAKEAVKMQEIASIKEEIALKILDQEMESKRQITQQEIEDILSQYGTVNKNEDGTIKNLIPTGKEYEIAYEEIYSGTISQEVNDGENTDNDADSDSNLDTVTLTREQYNKIIARLDALDGGSESLVSISDVSSSINNINSNFVNENMFYNLEKVNLSDLVTTDYQFFTAPYSGYYYMFSSSSSNSSGYAFIRLGNKNYNYSTVSPTESYAYCSSPIIYLEKGTEMIAQGSDTEGAVNVLICHKTEI